MMPPFVVFPTNRIAHFVEVSLYLFYLAQRVNLCIKNTYKKKIEYDMRKGTLIRNVSFFVDFVQRGICKTHANEAKLG